MKIKLIIAGVALSVGFFAGWSWNGARIESKWLERERVRLAAQAQAEADRERREQAQAKALRTLSEELLAAEQERRRLRDERDEALRREPLVVTKIVEAEPGDVVCPAPDFDRFRLRWNAAADPDGVRTAP